MCGDTALLDNRLQPKLAFQVHQWFGHLKLRASRADLRQPVPSMSALALLSAHPQPELLLLVEPGMTGGMGNSTRSLTSPHHCFATETQTSAVLTGQSRSDKIETLHCSLGTRGEAQPGKTASHFPPPACEAEASMLVLPSSLGNQGEVT